MDSNSESKPIVLFGIGSFSSLLTKYIRRFTNWDIAAYTIDDAYFQSQVFLGKPIIPFSILSVKCPPDIYDTIIAVGYTSMGSVRQDIFIRLKEAGYHIRNFLHPDASCFYDSIGEGNIVLEKVIISIGTTIKDANLMFCNTNIAHDTTVGSFNTFAPSSAFGGFTIIEDNCFFGINSTCKNGLTIASRTFVGASAYITRDTEEDSAYIAKPTLPTERTNVKSIKQFLNEK